MLLTVNAIAASVGWAAVAVYYGAPLLVFGTFLVVTTFLHHNDEDTPWYADSAWTYVKGSLSSVDRDYGALVNNVSHNIHLHQIHHLFPKIPHYRLRRGKRSVLWRALRTDKRNRSHGRVPRCVSRARAREDWLDAGAALPEPAQLGAVRVGGGAQRRVCVCGRQEGLRAQVAVKRHCFHEPF